MKLNADIVELAIEYACAHIANNVNEKFVYHNLSHTVFVIEKATELADKMRLDKQQTRILTVAAWFHDTGYSKQITDHETVSAALAQEFLSGYNIDQEEINEVRSCIVSTRIPQSPVSLLEKILCDADMMHLVSKNFMDVSNRLREEWEATQQKVYTDIEWLQLNMDFIAKHRFHTSHAQNNLESKKQKTIEVLKKKIKSEEEAKAYVKEKKKNERMERGVETMFKTASSNHMRLSGMADNKAHILLSINSIIISVIISFLARKLSETPNLIIPTIMLLCVSVTTIVFAVLTTKPKVSKGIFTKEQIINREVNLLFFGNFHQMELELYEWGVQEMMYDKDYLYKSITKDIYFLGKVLAAKYRYLNIGYRVFMYGLIASIAAFGISFLIAI